jgi:superfamily II DNA or RNA helicase
MKMPELRPYQEYAVRKSYEAWDGGAQSILGLGPTGMGKTVIGGTIAKRERDQDNGKVMILAHREELVEQWVNSLKLFELDADIEKAGSRASRFLSSIIIATPQTLYSAGQRRLQDWRPSEFGLFIFDEVHHGMAKSFKRCVDHFRSNSDCKVLGLTATADRHDGLALAPIIDKVAFEIPIRGLIKHGWLVNCIQHAVTIKSLDLSQCRVVAHEFVRRDLEEVVSEEKNLLGFADAIWQLALSKGKRTLCFCAGIRQAEGLANILNRYQEGVADWVCGRHKRDDRDKKLKHFRSGKTLGLCNCMVLTEGYDLPAIQAVAMCRPTLSRSLYAQCVGRGLRPIDDLTRLKTADLRLAAIAQSQKPHVEILDFVGNSGRHSLVTTIDLFAGKQYSEEAQKQAKVAIRVKRSGNPIEELEKAERQLRQEAERKKRENELRGIRGKATVGLTYVDPFQPIYDHLKQREHWKGHVQHRLSEKQRIRLIKNGWNPDDHYLHENLEKHRQLIQASQGQRNFLRRMGAPLEIYQDPDLVRWAASNLIDACMKNGKRWPYDNGADNMAAS